MVRPAVVAALAVLACASETRAQPGPTPDWSRAGGGLFANAPPEATADALAPTVSSEASTEPADVMASEFQAPQPVQPYAAAIADAAGRHGLDPRLLHALVVVESAYRPRAASHAGAAGLTQLMPGTATELGVADRLDPLDNLRGGAAYLARQVARFGDLRLALAAYNAGPGRVARTGRIPPIAETQAYVTAVVDCYLALSAGRSVRSARECPTDRSVR